MLLTGVGVLSGAYQMLIYKRAPARFTVKIIHSGSIVIPPEHRDIPCTSHSLIKV